MAKNDPQGPIKCLHCPLPLSKCTHLYVSEWKCIHVSSWWWYIFGSDNWNKVPTSQTATCSRRSVYCYSRKLSYHVLNWGQLIDEQLIININEPQLSFGDLHGRRFLTAAEEILPWCRNSGSNGRSMVWLQYVTQQCRMWLSQKETVPVP